MISLYPIPALSCFSQSLTTSIDSEDLNSQSTPRKLKPWQLIPTNPKFTYREQNYLEKVKSTKNTDTFRYLGSQIVHDENTTGDWEVKCHIEYLILLSFSYNYSTENAEQAGL